MSPEKITNLSETHRQWVSEIAEKIRNGDDFFKAVRQVLTNHSVTHEPDVQKLMSTFGPHVDSEIARQIAQEEERADVEEEIAALKRGEISAADQEEADRAEAANEHIISPDDEDMDYTDPKRMIYKVNPPSEN